MSNMPANLTAVYSDGVIFIKNPECEVNDYSSPPVNLQFGIF